MKILIFSSILFAFIAIVLASDDMHVNKYVVIASKLLRYKKPFRASIHVLSSLFEFEVRLTFVSNDGKFIVNKAVKMSKSVTDKIVEFDTTTFPVNANYFTFKVSSDDYYNEMAYIGIVAKENGLVIQTNKAVFKQSDLIQFRVFLVDPDLNAVNPSGPVDIKLIDSRQNEIIKFANVTLTNGKYSDQYQLSSKPNLGDWKISVQNNYQSVPTEKSFTVVEQYATSLFNVSLSVPQQVSLFSTKFPVTINAEYTFKQPVNGVAVVNITNFFGGNFIKTIPCTERSTTFFVDIFNDLGYSSSCGYESRISLDFTDSKTNIKDSDEKRITILSYLYKLEFVNDFTYKSGANVSYTLVSKTIDDKPAPNVQILVKIFDFKAPTSDPPIAEVTLTTSTTGTVKSIYKTNITNPLFLRFQASCPQCVNASSYAKPLGIKPTQGIKLELVNHRPSVKDNLNILATFAEKVDQFLVFVIAKGVLLESRRITVNGVSSEFSIKPDCRYAPVTKLYAFYYKSSVEKFYDTSLRIPYKKELPNYVKLSLQGADATGNVVAKPGSNISLTVTSNPSSTVSLSAIDQRVLTANNPQILDFDELLYTAKYVRQIKPCSDCLDDYSYYHTDLLDLHFYTNVDRFDFILNLTQNIINLMDEQTLPSGQSTWLGLEMFQMDQASVSAPLTQSGPTHEDLLQGVLPNDQELLKMDGSAPAPTTSITTRADFSETWLWEDVTVTSGSAAISRKVPDTISTYFIYGVAMSKTNGIGLATTLPSATIFLPFFISLETFPTIKRNESISLEIKVFNYLKANQTATLTVTKDVMFDATNFLAEGWTNTSTAYTKQIKIVNNDFTTSILTIKPKTIGVLNIKVAVTCPTAGDAIQKSIRVIFEGIPRTITTSTLVYINSTTIPADKLLKCELPASAISESAEISASVTGAILGKAMNNLNHWIILPTGCPEQTMHKLVPNYAILKYLNVTGKLTADLKTKLISYLTTGYTEMLRFQNVNDGSFSGSTWLTGYVAMYFNIARQTITVNSALIEKALNFIISKQNVDGSFTETGTLYNHLMQDGIAKNGYLTIVLTELAKNYSTAVPALNLAVPYLEQQLSTISDTFALAIVACALQFANSPSATTAYNLLFARKIEITEKNQIYWSASVASNVSLNVPRSLNIETTAYALKLHMARNGDQDITLKIVRYLVSQGNQYGGFASTQDTNAAITALSTFATSNVLAQQKVNLKLTPNVGTALTAQLTAANMFTIQSFNLNSTARQLNVHVETGSTGVAVVSLICNFYEDPSKAVSSYDITYDFGNSCKFSVHMKVCAKLLTEDSNNMAIMEVRMPTSYYYFDVERSVNEGSGVSNVEVFDSSTTAVFYFDKISTNGSCFTLGMGTSYMMNNLKPGSISVNDYYDTSLQGSSSFSLPASVLNTSC